MELKIKYEELKTFIDNIKNYISSLEDMIEKLENKSSELKWSASKLVSDLANNKDDYDAEIKNLNEIIEELKSDKKDISNFYELAIRMETEGIDINAKGSLEKLNEALKVSESSGKETEELKEILKGNSDISKTLAGYKNLKDNGFIEPSQSVADPVNVATGNFISRKIDMNLLGYNGIEFARFYNSRESVIGFMGKGWRHNFEIKLEFKDDGIYIIFGDGRAEKFERIDDKYITKDNKELIINYDNYIFEFEEEKYTFGKEGNLISIEDKNKNITNLFYENKILKKVEKEKNIFTLRYNENNLIKEVEDKFGRFVQYNYEKNFLVKVKDFEGLYYEYKYDEKGRLNKIFDQNRVLKVFNIYDDENRVIVQKTADDTKVNFYYDGKKKTTIFTDKNGSKKLYKADTENRVNEINHLDNTECRNFDDNGNLISYIDKNGNEYVYEYNRNGNRIKEIDPLGNITKFEYNENGKRKKVILPDSSEYNYSYDMSGNLIVIINPLNEKIKILYDEKNNMSRIIFTDNTMVKFSYDNKGNLINYTDEDGNITKASYDNLSRISNIVNPKGNKMDYSYTLKDQLSKVVNFDGTIKSYIYNNRGTVKEFINEEGSKTKFEYDDSDRIIKYINAMNLETKYDYDEMGNISKIEYPNEIVYKYKYDEKNNIEKVINPEGYESKYKYDSNGNLIKIIDAKGNEIKYEYDKLNRVTKYIDAEGNTKEYKYRFDGKILSVSNSLDAVENYVYDKLGRIIEKIDCLGNKEKFKYDIKNNLILYINKSGETTKYRYYKNGKISKITYPDASKESFIYDENGNLVLFKNKKDSITKYFYDEMNRVVKIVDALGSEKLIEYTKLGKIASVTDKNGNKTNYKYDILQRLVEVKDALNNKTSYKYDDIGNLTEIHRYGKLKNNGMIENITTKYVYDKRGLVTKEIDSFGAFVEFKYDSNGNLISKIDKDKSKIDMEYNPLNKIKKIIYSNEKKVEFKYNSLGYLKEVIDWIGYSSYKTDLLGRITEYNDFNGKKVEYTWKENNKKESIKYPDGETIFYDYDNMDRLTKVRDLNCTLCEYSYDPEGKIKEKIIPDKISTNYTYDVLSRLIGIENKVNGELRNSYEFEYDKIFNKKKINKNGKEFFYNYDELNRLSEVTEPDNILKKYSYNSLGNRMIKKVSKNNEIVSELRYNYDKLDKLIEIKGTENVKFNYDEKGNLIEKISKDNYLKLEFDETNKLTKSFNGVNYTSYTYDGTGKRIKVNNTDYIYDITLPFRNVLSDNKNNYIYGYDLIESNFKDNKTYYFTDYKGTVEEIIDENGFEEENFYYDEFGVTDNKKDNPLGFTGHQNDGENGLVYANSRYYMSDIGRFISEDKYHGEIINPNTLNRYTYCENNPVNCVDPLGFCSEYENFVSNYTIESLFYRMFNKERHFNRNKFNTDLPETYDEMKELIGNEKKECEENNIEYKGWRIEKGKMYHTFNDSNSSWFSEEKNVIKYVNDADGREVVYDLDNGGVIENLPENKASYNYSTPGGVKGGLDHFIDDMVPYFRYGNDENDTTSIGRRILRFVEVPVINVFSPIEKKVIEPLSIKASNIKNSFYDYMFKKSFGINFY